MHFTHIFAAKNNNVFESTLGTTVNDVIIDELVKLLMLWANDPWKKKIAHSFAKYNTIIVSQNGQNVRLLLKPSSGSK